MAESSFAPPPGAAEHSADRFEVTEVSNLSLLRLQIFHRRQGAMEELAQRLEFQPPGPGEVSQHGGADWYWSAPGEWIIATTPETESEVIESLKAVLDDLLTVLTVATDSRAIFEATGPGSRDVLARGSTVDFDRQQFSPGSCVTTRFAGVAAMIACISDDHFLIFVDQSLRNYLANWLGSARFGR